MQQKRQSLMVSSMAAARLWLPDSSSAALALATTAADKATFGERGRGEAVNEGVRQQ